MCVCVCVCVCVCGDPRLSSERECTDEMRRGTSDGTDETMQSSPGAAYAGKEGKKKESIRVRGQTNNYSVSARVVVGQLHKLGAHENRTRESGA